MQGELHANRDQQETKVREKKEKNLLEGKQHSELQYTREV